MKRLNYKTLEEINYDGYILKDAPERILQFGEGNFLRGFVDYFVDMMNEKSGFNSKVVLCQPIASGLSDIINSQEGLYTLILRGTQNNETVNEKRIISCVSRCLNPYTDYAAVLDCASNADLRFIVCNTTEAGIVYDSSCQFTDMPASSYPGKLTQFLYRRFQLFGATAGKGFVILSCELIDNNGKELKRCVLEYAKQWALGDEFVDWIEKENIFCSTLVDRIVTGYPRNTAEKLCEEFGYEDQLIDTAEIFGLWVIEGPAALKEELPFEDAQLPIITDNHTPYKQRKVRILNGAHTSFVLGAFLAGQNIVRDCMNDSIIRDFMNKTIYEEIIPTLDLPVEDLKDFASSVVDRFNNPFIDHALLDISLNSTSKWKARVLPSLKEYVKRKGSLPRCIVTSFAFYISFFAGKELCQDGLHATRPNGDEYVIRDSKEVLDFYFNLGAASPSDLVHSVCTNTDFWGEDLTKIEGFEEMVLDIFNKINSDGAYAVM